MTFGGTPSVSRRQFVRAAAVGSAVLATGLPLLSCDSITGPPDSAGRTALPRPPSMAVQGSLVATAGVAALCPDLQVAAFMLNGSVPSPTIRARRGEVAQLQFVNQLADPTILHWHGLIVPADADGHPRDTVPASGQYQYAFPIVQRAGTYWYHPHAHHLTAMQVHRGMAGFFVVSDDEEDALQLPGGSREFLLMLQDRAEPGAAPFEYAPSPADLHVGMLRDVAYGNGVPRPTALVPPGPCRLRILNASHARVYRLALDGGTPLTVIGNDGGLLPAPVTAESVYLGVGERIDCLVDLAAVRPGGRVMLRSLPFALPSAAGATSSQGTAMDLLELIRLPGDAPRANPLPLALSNITPHPAPSATRTFVFTSAVGASHRINGLSYDINRIDIQIPLGQVERWVFQNDGDLPHPVHLHGTQFQVASRSGGRNVVYPYEMGWKDTVLVFPEETVAVTVRFDTYAGVYLLHCHNLQHEDDGMMLNVEVTQ